MGPVKMKRSEAHLASRRLGFCMFRVPKKRAKRPVVMARELMTLELREVQVK